MATEQREICKKAEDQEEVEDLANFLKKNEDFHDEVDLSNSRKIKIATHKLTGKATVFW
jgi:hypothetical protein